MNTTFLNPTCPTQEAEPVSKEAADAFPVQWLRPDDATHHWTRDREHMPKPITPMYNSFAALTATEGRAPTVEPYAESIIGRDDRIVNGYDFTRLIAFTGTEEEMTQRIRRHREVVGAVSARLQEVWEQDWRPELESIWAFWANFDLENASDAELAAHLEGTIQKATRMWEIHYWMGPPMWFAIEEFVTYYCDLFPQKTVLNAHRLLQGFESKTAQINRCLWELGQTARQEPEVARVLCEQTTEKALTALQAFAAGQKFLEALAHFLKVYGQRSELWDWGYPSWADEPAPVLGTIRQYLAQPDREYSQVLAQAAAEREEAIAEARRALQNYPPFMVSRFEQLLRSAQTALLLTEDHTYYIDFNGFGWIHRLIGEFGKRFAARGLLQTPEHVFFLKFDELRELAAAPSGKYCALAAARKEELDFWLAHPAPAELGPRPEKPMLVYSADGLRMARYCGVYLAEPQPAAKPGLLQGQPGSSGKACGRARVILNLADANRLEAGDILVTATTAPPWTPLFMTAAALVTDAGGMLSHGAVVAREFRIPAVVGAFNATSRIRDGQWIEVDGSHGIVKFDEHPS